MPRSQRNPEEIEAIRKNIMKHALDLIISDGYAGFSMRKLANRLGFAAKTIYNYFHNQDELYLCLLTEGFERLHAGFVAAVDTRQDPMDQLEAAIRAYVAFGLEHGNIYSLMFTLYVPKYNDYIGTPMEQVAYTELTSALKCVDFFMDRIRACLGDGTTADEDEIRVEMIQIWSHMHGYVAGINNSLLDYMHDHPIELKNRITDRIIDTSQRELKALRQRLALNVTPEQKPD